MMYCPNCGNFLTKVPGGSLGSGGNIVGCNKCDALYDHTYCSMTGANAQLRRRYEKYNEYMFQQKFICDDCSWEGNAFEIDTYCRCPKCESFNTKKA